MIEFIQQWRPGTRASARDSDPYPDGNPRRAARCASHRHAALAAGAGFRPDGFRLRPSRRDSRQRHAQPGPVRAQADRPRQDRSGLGGAGQWRHPGPQRHAGPEEPLHHLSGRPPGAHGIRLSAPVEHLPDPDPAHRRCHEAGLQRSGNRRSDPARRAGRRTGGRSSTPANCTTAPPIAITGKCLQKARVTGVKLPAEAEAAFFG
jgi:hypothetical protein